ncbi:TonB-dependent receptor [Pontibacter qinzhouensis]|uniref:TonB-dependent receptor n=1 Tax=Pontibacter qinzhouensis TaxID=2603253 RepID=A0A5C8K9H7_9BACT|nr:TonB-dependent receptor [Pontibacter qinzhouensis]TXK49096.1 TonB-dependent receptor [Pontibacter qinzhouensis]
MHLPSYLLSLFLLLLLVKAPLAQAQVVNATITGQVRSATDRQPLPGATVGVPQLGIGTITDAKGMYRLELPAGTYTLQVSFIGYETITQPLTVGRTNQELDFRLEDGGNMLQEVVVEANTLRQKLNTNQMSVEQLTSTEAKLLPALFGEVDLLKTLQLKPGVQSGGEGASGLYVRGGGPDQNLVLLDDAVIYNPSHLFGFFSVFNPDAVRSVELYKGGFPAQFGGRLSSVVDVELNKGNPDNYRVTGGLGVISSRLTLEGPLVKDKASFIISGRRTYSDVFTRMLNKANEGSADYSPIPDYYFYDLNGKFNYKLSRKDELTFSSYYGRDFFKFSDASFKVGFDWGNTMASLGWRHSFNARAFVNTTVSTSSYQYTIANQIDVFSLRLRSDIQDFTLKTDFNLILNEKHHLKIGAVATNHSFTIGRLNFDGDDDRFSVATGNSFGAIEFGAYVSDDYEVNPLLTLNYGLRFSGFSNSGKNYFGVEPRASAKYNLTETLVLKGSFASMMQYIHLVANSGASLPTDVWYPSSPNVKPQRSQQVAFGASKLLGKGKYLLTNEVYYKWMHNQIDFRDGANLFVNDSLENEFLFGKGESYGNELYLEKIQGRTTGWIGYTLSWTYRQFADINDGRRFPNRYDRRHDISVVLLHKLNKRISLTGAFVYGTGNAYSLPVARFAMQDIEGRTASIVPIYSDRNSFRLAAYHRLDLGLVLKMKPKRGESDLTFSIYNAYNRRNPYFVYFDQINHETEKTPIAFKAKQVSLFPVIPSVTYNFKF